MTMRCAAELLATVEIVAQRESQIGFCGQQQMIDSATATAMRDLIDKPPHCRLIGLSKRPRLGLQFVWFSVGRERPFNVAEQDRIVERKFDLVAIENVKHKNLV